MVHNNYCGVHLEHCLSSCGDFELFPDTWLCYFSGIMLESDSASRMAQLEHRTAVRLYQRCSMPSKHILKITRGNDPLR